MPDKEQVARLILDLVAKDEKLAAYYPLVRSGVDFTASIAGEDLLKHFYNLVDKLKEKASGKIYRLLLRLYANVPVPLFYQDLALLIKGNFFERTLTTNIDTLLEQALNIAGLQVGYDYQVTSVGMAESGLDGESGYGTQPELDEAAHPKQIIKLFGDLAQEQVNINPWDIDIALKSQRRYVKSELEGDIVMVGYNFESKPINEWLTKGGSFRNQLWWVSEGQPVVPPGTPPVESWARQVNFITGAAGKPQDFFSQLKLRLLRRPAFEFPSYADAEGKGRRWRESGVESQWAEPAEVREESFSFGGVSGEEASEGTDLPDADVAGGSDAPDAAPAEAVVIVPPEELNLIEELRGNIRRSQAVLFSLEQTAVPGDVPVSVRTQAAYQKQQIAEMEDRVRGLASSRQGIIQTLDALMQDVMKAQIFPPESFAPGTTSRPSLEDSTIEFLKSQVQIIKDECERDKPNHYILGTAIGAVTVLVERLCVEFGPDAVKPENVRRLAALAPSLAGRELI